MKQVVDNIFGYMLVQTYSLLNNRHHTAFTVIGNDRLLLFGGSHAELFFIVLDVCPSVSEDCFFISPL